MRKRLMSALVAFCMALTLMPSWALAEETADIPSNESQAEQGEAQTPEEGEGETPGESETPEAPETEDTEPSELPETGEGETVPSEETPAGEAEESEEPEIFIVEIDEDDFYDNDILFDAYVMDVLGINPDGGVSTMSEDFGGSAESLLTSDEKDLYKALKPFVMEVAEGKRSSTKFDFSRSYPAAKVGDSVSKVVHALMVDFPASLYWWGRSYSYRSDGTHIELRVAVPYRANNDEHTFNTSKVSAVNTALNTAKNIVSQAASKNDYEKLKFYLEEISRLVKYDYASYYASNGVAGYANEHPEPWALVNVFDGDPNTNVVCEGYSKAFQYLCDRTTWQGDVKCYTVSGDMAGGAHMWNIVRIDGKSYLMDATNCDYTYDWVKPSGNDWSSNVLCTDRLFLVGGASKGNGSYDVTQEKWDIPNSGGYYFKEKVTNYTYNENTIATYPSSILTLSPTRYVYTPPKVLEGTVTITGSTGVGDTLTADTTGITSSNPGTFTYEWKVAGTAAGTGKTYTIKAADINKQITVTVSASNYTTTLTSAPVTAGKGSAGEATPADIELGANNSSIIVKSTLRTQQYAISESGTPSASLRWVNGTGSNYTFSGLSTGRTYYIYTRVAETASAAAGEPVSCGSITIKGKPVAADFTLGGNTSVYSGKDQTAAVTGKTGIEGITVSYKLNNTGDFLSAMKNAGTYTVYVTTTESDQFNAVSTPLALSARYTITAAPVEIVMPASFELSVGQTKPFGASLSGIVEGDGAHGITLAYTSGSTRYATVNRTTGDVTGVAAGKGSITVTASLNGSRNYRLVQASKSLTITVDTRPRYTLTFENPTPGTLAVGSTLTNPATAAAEGMGTAPTIKYSASPAGVVEVNETTGAVKALQPRQTVTITATATPPEGENFAVTTATYTLKTVAAAITPTIEFVDGASFPYDPEGVQPAIRVKNGSEVLDPDSYTVVYGNNTAVTNAATVTVTPKDDADYAWADPDNDGKAVFSIVKAVYEGETDFAKNQFYGDTEGVFALTLEELDGLDTTVSTFVSGTAAGIFSSIFLDAEGKVNFRFSASESDVDKAATLTIPIKLANYEDFNVTLVITLVNKESQTAYPVPTVTVRQNADGTWTASITPTYPGAEYTFDGAAPSASSTQTGIPGGSRITGGVRKPETATHLHSPWALAGEIFVGPGITPNGGSVSGEKEVTLHAAPGMTVYYTTDGTEPTTSSTEYTAAFKVKAGVTVKAIAVDGSGNVSSVSSARFSTPSSGGGGGSSTPGTIISNNGGTKPGNTATTTPSKPANPTVSNGSDSTTATPSATVSGDTASVSITGTVGQELVDSAVDNGSSTVVIAPSIPGSAGKTEVTINSSVISGIADRTEADLVVETPAADVTIRSNGLSSLASKGGSVVVSTSAEGSTVNVTITAGGSAVSTVPGGVKVSVPAGSNPGLVPVITKADGSTELLRKSVTSGGAVTVTLPGSASVTLKDNAKNFRDVPAGNWAANAVAFVSSRELMNGTGDGVFNPNTPMTRAMLAKVLHNLESNPAAGTSSSFSDIASDAWCAEAVQWAAAQGIVSGYADGGFKPNSYITREQLAVMLYRYAGSPSVSSTSLRFADASQVGGYAQAALAWATQNGVINGKGGNLLDPKGQATRAQVAQMLLNYITNIG